MDLNRPWLEGFDSQHQLYPYIIYYVVTKFNSDIKLKWWDKDGHFRFNPFTLDQFYPPFRGFHKRPQIRQSIPIQSMSVISSIFNRVDYLQTNFNFRLWSIPSHPLPFPPPPFSFRNETRLQQILNQWSKSVVLCTWVGLRVRTWCTLRCGRIDTASEKTSDCPVLAPHLPSPAGTTSGPPRRCCKPTKRPFIAPIIPITRRWTIHIGALASIDILMAHNSWPAVV